MVAYLHVGPPQCINYLNRGFKVFKEEDIEEIIPAEPLQPWEGAAKPS